MGEEAPSSKRLAKSGSGSRLSRSLLGSDAFVETGRARRVPGGFPKQSGTKKSRTGEVQGPLLNCTAESRRRAQQEVGPGGMSPRTEAALRKEEASLRRAALRTARRTAFRAVAVFAAGAMAWRLRDWSESLKMAAVGLWTVAAILAARAWRAPLLVPELVPRQRSSKGRQRPTARMLATCWESSERAPPLPLAGLPDSDIDEPWMHEAGIAPRWTESERRFLARAKATYADRLEAPAVKYLDAYGDRRLLRFLRQDPTQDEDRAVAKVGEYLDWRRRTNADAARRRVDADGADPTKWPHGDVLLECIRLLQCSDTFFDTQGFAVTVYRAFHWPAPALRRQVGGMSTKQLVDFATFGAEYNAVQMDRIALARERVLLDHAKQLWLDRHKPRPASRLDAQATPADGFGGVGGGSRLENAAGLALQGDASPGPRTASTASTAGTAGTGAETTDLPWHRHETPCVYEGWGELTRLCAITDMEGCTFGSVAMPQLIPAVIQAVSLFVNYYPFIVGELHVINCAPIIAKIFKRALNAVVPKHIADQIQIHVHRAELLRSVRPHNLPKHVGGQAECPCLDPPPPPPPRAARARSNQDRPKPTTSSDEADKEPPDQAH